MVAKLLKIRIRDQKFAYILMLIGYVIGAVIGAVSMINPKKDETTFEAGTMFMLMFAVLFCVLMDAINFSVEFNLAIGMGVLRKKFVPAYIISSVILFMVQMAVVYLGHFAEAFAINKWYPQFEKEAGIEKLLMSWYVIPFIIFVPAFALMWGAFVTKFGKKASIVFWFLWMFGCFLPGRITDEMEKNSGNVLDKLGTWFGENVKTLSISQGMIFIFLGAVVSMVVAFALLRKQQVTQM